MQRAEAEIILPVQTGNRCFSTIFFHLPLTLFGLGLYIWLIVLTEKLGLRNQNIWGIAIMGVLWLLGLILNGWSIVGMIRKRLASPPVYRISHEGICFPSPVNWLSYEGTCFPVLVRWDEIKALFPYTVPNGVPAIGIVLGSYEAFLARSIQENSPGALRRFFISANARILRGNPRYLAQVNIPQRNLPLSIEELLTEIRTRFAAELQEYRITVLGWQN